MVHLFIYFCRVQWVVTNLSREAAGAQRLDEPL